MKQRPSPSIAGPRPIRFWVIKFGGYFLGSVTAVTALVTLLDWYKLPTGAEAVQPRLIASAAIIIFCLAAIASLVHLASDYRRRFRLHRDRGLVRDLYPTRDRLRQHYKDVLFGSVKKFRVVGISLHTLLSEPNLGEWLHQALSQNQELRICLCFLKPYSDFVKQREKSEHRGEGRISHDCLLNAHRALEIKRALGALSDRFHIYQYDTAPIAFLLQRDSEIYFEPYLERDVGRTFPTFVLARNEANAEAFDKFAHHIDILTEGPELTEMRHGTPLITRHGETRERMELKRAIFLDRDGVLVEDTGYISSAGDLRLIPGVVDVLRQLQRDFRLIVITNQSGVARGYFAETDLFEINQRLVHIFDDREVAIDAIYYCPHHPTDGVYPYKFDCECRKPKPGLFLAAAKQFGIDLKRSITIGDAPRDIEAGKAAGTLTILLQAAISDETKGSYPDRSAGHFEHILSLVRELSP